MSCLNPITLRNPSKGFRDGVDKTYIQVPCGSCSECRKNMQADWATRAYIEMQHTLQRGGFTLFPTLTYDNAHLPYFDSDADKGYHIPCFSKSDIDRFINSLRKHYDRRGISGIKYLICSEYGGNDDYIDSKGRIRTATNRPHYHALLHFPSGIDRNDAMKQIQRFWTNGRVGWSPNGAEIISFEGCQYVSKYVTKDINYAERRDLSSYLATYHSDRETRLEAVKTALPRHWQSKGYGRELENLIKSSEDPSKFIHDGYRIPLTETIRKIPRYILNRLCYEYTEDGRRQYSEFGKRMKRELFNLDIEDISTAYREMQTAQGIRNLIDDGDVSKLVPRGSADDINSLVDYLRNLISGYSLDHVAIYQKVFRGTSYDCDPRYKRFFDVLPKIKTIDDLDRFKKVAFAYYNNRNKLSVLWNEKEDEPQTHNKAILSQKDATLFNKLEVFRNLEEYITIMSNIRALSNDRKGKFSEKHEKILKKLRDMHNFSQIA